MVRDPHAALNGKMVIISKTRKVLAERKKPKNNSRTLILANARELFWKKGYEGTTVREIAQACSFDSGNLYNYFTSKEAILYEILRNDASILASAAKKIQADESLKPIEQLKLLIEMHVKNICTVAFGEALLSDVGLKDLSDVHRQNIISLRDAYDSALSAIIASGIESGDFTYKNEKLARIFIASIIARTGLWFSPAGKLPTKEIANEIFTFVLNGLR